MLRIYYAGCVHNGKCIKSVSSPSVRVVSQRWCDYWGVAVSESPRPAPARPANVSALLSDKRFTLTLVLYVTCFKNNRYSVFTSISENR